jgi:hypothetical protein
MTLTQDNIIRRCVFRPYKKGMGPTFRLVTWLAGTNQQPQRSYQGPRDMLGYRLTMHDNYAGPGCHPSYRTVLFEGEDFGNSPMHGIDSDEAVAGIMAFLTLRPGDTDPEYFADYTPAQLEYCSQHAEALSCEVESRFGEEE